MVLLIAHYPIRPLPRERWPLPFLRLPPLTLLGQRSGARGEGGGRWVWESLWCVGWRANAMSHGHVAIAATAMLLASCCLLGLLLYQSITK
eukprot:scaffold10948_cov132-Isochrysis_galbana.AAC.7